MKISLFVSLKQVRCAFQVNILYTVLSAGLRINWMGFDVLLFSFFPKEFFALYMYINSISKKCKVFSDNFPLC